jgi:hypothetical protein
MSRRTTTIGIGAFGNLIDPNEHMKQTYNRIRAQQLPLTEDAVFVLTYFLLLQRGKIKSLFKAVRQSKDGGDYRYFNFSPDIDLLEVRTDDSVVGYELKGIHKTKQGTKAVTYYEGLDQALSYLVNPIYSPMSDKLPSQASIFDFVYLVHPEQEDTNQVERDAFVNIMHNFTPIGLIYVSHNRWKEVLPPRPNPFLNPDLKNLFLQNLDAFKTYTKFRLSLVQ